MKKFLALLATLTLALPSFAQEPTKTADATLQFVSNTLFPATVLLYSQDQSGGMKMRCTATAIEKTPTGYEFATAAHCGCKDNIQHKTVSPENTFFYITRDASKEKVYVKATIDGCGYRQNGDDLMLLSIETKETFPIVKLGKDPAVLEQVVNVASPLGLGRQVFLGSVTSPVLDRPVIADNINWTGAVLLQMFGTAGGSSGSSAVCLDQQAICAFVVGVISDTTITAMPVSRLIHLREKLKAGTYKYWVKEPVPNTEEN